jgi:predicted transcriptional regulator
VVCIPGRLTVAEAIPAYFVRHLHPAYPVLDDDARVVGLLTVDAVRRVAPELRDGTPVAAIADRDPELLARADESIADVLTRPAFARGGHVVAVDDEQRPLGMFAAVDLQRWIEMTSLLPAPRVVPRS